MCSPANKSNKLCHYFLLLFSFTIITSAYAQPDKLTLPEDSVTRAADKTGECVDEISEENIDDECIANENLYDDIEKDLESEEDLSPVTDDKELQTKKQSPNKIKPVLIGVGICSSLLFGSLALALTRDSIAYTNIVQDGIFNYVTISDTQYHLSSAKFSPDGNKFVSKVNRNAYIFDINKGKRLLTLKHAADYFSTDYEGIFSPDGSKFATIKSGSSIQIWNANRGGLLCTIEKEKSGWLENFQFSPDGTKILTYKLRNPIAGLWDANTGNLIRKLEGNTYNNIAFAQFSPCGKQIAIQCYDKIIIWNTQENNPSTITVFDEECSIPAILKYFGDNPTTALICTINNRLIEYNVVTRAKIRELIIDDIPGTIGYADKTPICFSPDGTKLLLKAGNRLSAIGVYENTTILTIDMNTKKLLPPIQNQTPEDCFYSVSVSPDSSKILTTSKMGAIRIWDIYTGSLLHTTQGQITEGIILTAAFSPDGSKIAFKNHNATTIWQDTRRLDQCKAFARGLGCSSSPISLIDESTIQHIVTFAKGGFAPINPID